MREQYVTLRRTSNEIAAECGVAANTILRRLVLLDIPVRSKSESRRGRHLGAENPSWKGGVAPERQRVYRSGVWKDVVKAVYERDAYTCVRCGSGKKSARGLHAHHVRPWADHPELRMDAANLVTLCRSCHGWVHSNANEHGELLAAA